MVFISIHHKVGHFWVGGGGRLTSAIISFFLGSYPPTDMSGDGPD